ncbi:MAG: hypothetical protein IIA36_12255, partial [Proteobacteria bacterium]|nr:hypothetical protein [Pseudomonadota bacterium]
IFQTAYTGIIVHATFPPGLARIQLQDNTLKFLNEQLPDLLTRDNFIADPLFAKNLRSRSEGRFEESEIFAMQDPLLVPELDLFGKAQPFAGGTLPLSTINPAGLLMYGKGPRPVSIASLRTTRVAWPRRSK